jgi:serine phosphatase RsbU (regulator of sigma subunit)
MIRKFHCLLIFFLLLPVKSNLISKDNNHFLISERMLEENLSYSLSQNWKFHSGDNKQWANPDFDDDSWETAETGLNEDNMPKEEWTGSGWFRLNLKIDSSLQGKTIQLIIRQAGITEFYSDGTFICKISDWKYPKTIQFKNKTNYVIAVKYFNKEIKKFHIAGFPGGFYLRFANNEKIMEYNTAEISRIFSQQMFFTALTLAFGLLHLILFLSYRTYKENLIYSIFLFIYAASTFFDYQALLSVNFNEQLIYLRIHRILMPFGTILSLLFLYYVFQPKLSWQFWIITLALLITGFFAFLKPIQNFQYMVFAQGLMFIECFRLTFSAIKIKTEGAWLIATGFSILLLFSLYDFFIDLNLINQIGNIENGYPFGTIGLFIFMSIYVAKGFAKVNIKIIEQERTVKEQELERRLLEADNERKTKELEEARKLQLSILPKTIPQFDNLEIAAGMQTATEVGGDYYDFHVSNDGTITIAIGDATGHGTKAGIMVALIKSMFDSMAHTFFIPDFFHHCTKIIKRMNLGNLYMCMSLIKIKGNRLVTSSAGMPPMLIFKHSNATIDEVIIKGMPMGAVEDFSYQQETRKLESGDVILLMTDGLMELFNDKKDMFGFEKVKKVFEEIALKSPGEILDSLFTIAEDWRNSKPQDDDLTFVVIKVK